MLAAARLCRVVLFLVLTFCRHLHEAGAQLYQFVDEPIPESKSLRTVYAFYVYSHQDAPDRSLGSPFVKFHGLVAKSTSPPAKELASGGEQGSVDKLADKLAGGLVRSNAIPSDKLEDYLGIQLSIIPYDHFFQLITPGKVCSAPADVTAGYASNINQLLVSRPANLPDTCMHTHTVRFGTPTSIPKDVQVPVRLTGVYILVFSNCGSITNATVSGSVVVKNAYGFLPGNEYHKMPFYGWLSLGYAGLAVTWMTLSFRWWRELIHIQGCIAGVILLGLVESSLWWTFYNDWNSSGSRGKFLFVLAIMATVLKSIFSYMLVLVASIGWGVTRPHLDQRIIVKILAISVSYIVMGFIRETVLSFRHSHSLSLAFVLLCLLPVSMLNGGISYWIFTALSGLMETLEKRRQYDKLVLFKRLWKVLVFAMGIASLMLIWQILDLSRSITIRWHYQWLYADGIFHLLFFFVLVVMMYLWAPHTNSQRYAYSHQSDAKDEKDELAPSRRWADEEAIEEEDDDEAFWATTHGTSKADDTLKKPKPTPAAEKIGKNVDTDEAGSR